MKWTSEKPKALIRPIRCIQPFLQRLQAVAFHRPVLLIDRAILVHKVPYRAELRLNLLVPSAAR